MARPNKLYAKQTGSYVVYKLILKDGSSYVGATKNYIKRMISHKASRVDNPVVLCGIVQEFNDAMDCAYYEQGYAHKHGTDQVDTSMYPHNSETNKAKMELKSRRMKVKHAIYEMTKNRNIKMFGDPTERLCKEYDIKNKDDKAAIQDAWRELVEYKEEV